MAACRLPGSLHTPRIGVTGSDWVRDEVPAGRPVRRCRGTRSSRSCGTALLRDRPACCPSLLTEAPTPRVRDLSLVSFLPALGSRAWELVRSWAAAPFCAAAAAAPAAPAPRG